MKNLRYVLLFVGAALSVAGFITSEIEEKWGALSLGLMVVGILLILGVLLSLSGGLPSFLEKRSTQIGTNALVATLAMLGILASVNFVAARYPVRFDLTETQLFTLAPQTKQLVGNLTKPLKVWIFQNNPNPIDEELLKRYKNLSSNFNYEYVDPQVKLGLAEKFKVESPGEVQLEYNSKNQLIQTLREGENITEIQLTNGIEKILRDRPPKVYFLRGHGELSLEEGEGGLSQAVSALEQKGYLIESLALTERNEVPKDATVLIIANPKQSLLKGEIEALKNYLKADGSLLLIVGQNESGPNNKLGIESILGEWGIELDDRLIIDPVVMDSVANLGPATPLVRNYGSHPITLDFKDGISFYPLSRGIKITEKENIEAQPIVITNEQAWGEKDLSPDSLEFDEKSDLAGPLNIGVALREKDEKESKTDSDAKDSEKDSETDKKSSESDENKEEETDNNQENQESDREKKEPRMVVFGNSNFVTNGWFNQQLNGDVFLNSVKWLAHEDQKVLSIRPKTLENRRLNISNQQGLLMSLIALMIVPLAGFIAAGIVWFLRR